MDIEKEIKKRKLTRKEFAELMGVSDVTVCRWISKERNLSRQSKMLLKLSNEELRKIKVD